MDIFLVTWPPASRWGYQLDWIVRAPTPAAAIEHIKNTVRYCFDNELTAKQIPLDGATETILSNGLNP